MAVEDVLRILYPGVQGLLSPKQASNLVLSLILLALERIDPSTFKFLTRYFTPLDYDELVQERTITRVCGYPLCGNPTKGPKTLTTFHWAGNYCSRHCYLGSHFYRKQLSEEPLVTRKDVAYESYGKMPYESNILLLDEVEHFARTNKITVVEAIREMMSEGLDRELIQLHIDTPAIDEEIKESLGDLGSEPPSLEIKERLQRR